MNLTIDNYRNKSSHREIDVLWFDHKIVSTEMIKEIIQWREWLEPENCTILYNDYWHRPKELKYKSFFKFWKSSGNTKIPIWKLIAIEWYGNIIIDLANNKAYYDSGKVFDYFIGFKFNDFYNNSIDNVKRQKNSDWYYDIINEKWDTIHLRDSYWDSAYDIIKHWKFSNSWLCIVYFYWATYDADTWYRTTHWFRIITTKWKCFADIGELSDIDLSWSRKDDDDAKDDFIQYMLQDKIELINGVAIVDTTSWCTLLNEEWTDILSKTYSNIYRCNNYFIAYNDIDLDDWIRIKQRSIIDYDWVIKVVNDINIPDDKMILWNTDFNIDDKDY